MDTHAVEQIPFYSLLLSLAVDRPRTEYFPSLHKALERRSAIDFFEAATIDANGEVRSHYRSVSSNLALDEHVDRGVIETAMRTGRVQTAGRSEQPTFVVAPLHVDGAMTGYLAAGAASPSSFATIALDDIV